MARPLCLLFVSVASLGCATIDAKRSVATDRRWEPLPPLVLSRKTDALRDGDGHVELVDGGSCEGLARITVVKTTTTERSVRSWKADLIPLAVGAAIGLGLDVALSGRQRRDPERPESEGGGGCGLFPCTFAGVLLGAYASGIAFAIDGVRQVDTSDQTGHVGVGRWPMACPRRALTMTPIVLVLQSGERVPATTDARGIVTLPRDVAASVRAVEANGETIDVTSKEAAP